LDKVLFIVTTGKMSMKKLLSLHLSQAKLTPPFSVRFVVPRTQLIGWVESAKHAKLIMLRAPAGFGKTTLMMLLLEHLREQGNATAWLTLDEEDNDPVRFLACLIAAVKKGIPGIDTAEPEPDLAGSGNSPASLLLHLQERLSALNCPLTIFLDDFDVIRSPEALQVVRRILHFLPPGKKIVIAFRRTPEIGIGRIRAHGELVEIDIQGLRFSYEEAGQFIRETQGLVFDDSEVEFLYRSTEGWPAGLQLSTLSSIWRERHGNHVQTFLEAFDNIADYLTEAVLARQPDEVRSFLLRTSILNRLSGPLCDALTGKTNSYEMLKYLEQENLFLVPLDGERRWYGYHTLFARFLRDRLEQEVERGDCVALHQAACDWHSEAGELAEAAEHALLAGNTEDAAKQMELCALDIVQAGLSATVAEWAERLPEHVLNRSPELQLSYAYALVFQQEYEKALAVIDKIGDNVRQSCIESHFIHDLRIVRAFVLMNQDKIEEFEREITEELSKWDALIMDSHVRLLPMLLNMSGMRNLISGRLEGALEDIWRAGRLIGQNNGVVKLYNKYFEGRIYLLQGKLNEVLALTRSVLQETLCGSLRHSAVGTAIAMLEAETLYEQNELERAEKLLMTYRSISPTAIATEAIIVGLRTLARIRLAHGDLKGCMRYLSEMERLGAQRGIPRVSASARQERIRIALQRGELEHAIQICRNHDERSIWIPFEGRYMMGSDPETPGITRLRLLIERGKGKEVSDPLRRELQKAEALGFFRQTLLLRILLAKAYDACGEKRRALGVLKDALVLAQEEGIIRAFVDEGDSLLKMVRELYRNTIAEETMGSSSLSVKYLDRILHAMGAVAAHRSSDDMKPDMDAFPLAPLTDREKDILEKLAIGFSSPELADKLCISVNTIRYHLRNIYSKLGGNNRLQAVALARRFGLIR
jgi:LuxR family maltose regulon positive regulatory protein